MSAIALKLLVPILPRLLTVVTPAFREQIRVFALDLQKRAAKTDNPWDDMLAYILVTLFTD